MEEHLIINNVLDEIKRRREKIGLTQSELAKLAGVSQSLIARIESRKNRIDPTLSTYLKIKKVLDGISQKKVSISSIYHYPVLSVSPDDTIEKAVKIMEKHDVSQLPVIKNDLQVGSISEGAIVRGISQRNLEKLSNKPVEELMEDPFPVIPTTTDLSILFHLLKQHSAVLVQEKKKVIGIITKHDVMRLCYR